MHLHLTASLSSDVASLLSNLAAVTDKQVRFRLKANIRVFCFHLADQRKKTSMCDIPNVYTDIVRDHHHHHLL